MILIELSILYRMIIPSMPNSCCVVPIHADVSALVVKFNVSDNSKWRLSKKFPEFSELIDDSDRAFNSLSNEPDIVIHSLSYHIKNPAVYEPSMSVSMHSRLSGV